MVNRVKHSNGISRRALLKGFGAGAAVMSMGTFIGRTFAQDAPPALSGPSALYRFNLGELEITVLKDAGIQLPAENFAVNASEEVLSSFLADNNFAGGAQNVAVDLMLVKSGDSLALIDTGVGSAFGFPGSLLPSLQAFGLSAADITNVIISHYHVDHISGLAEGGVLAFPNASVHISQQEWDFLQAPPQGFGDQVADPLARLQPALDSDQLFFYNDGEELLPGIQAVAAPGHSFGHYNFLMASGGQQLLNLIDTANHHLISLGDPNWQFVFDAVPEQAAETRRTLLQRAVDEKLFVFGYHWPFPGVGVIDTDGDGYRFIPAGM